MAIEDDMKEAIDWAKTQEGWGSPYARSVTAYTELRRFERATDAIKSRTDLDFWSDEECYPTIGKVVKDLIDGSITQDEAVRYLKIHKKIADRYLRSRGFSPDLMYKEIEAMERRNQSVD